MNIEQISLSVFSHFGPLVTFGLLFHYSVTVVSEYFIPFYFLAGTLLIYTKMELENARRQQEILNMNASGCVAVPVRDWVGRSLVGVCLAETIDMPQKKRFNGVDVLPENDNEACYMCYKNKAQVIATVCGHSLGCFACANRREIQRCPLCREELI